ncbi:Uncharacterized protein Fot_39961 [Forsythia ovata]|uniref:Uncharacterized protein n=1 Tax=Forsythia ovata TaxID=205694 RepID=A0ABD1S634_9LAMI
MANPTIVAALLLSLLVFNEASTITTTVTTTTIEEEEENPGRFRQCQKQVQGRQFRYCKKLMMQGSPYNEEPFLNMDLATSTPLKKIHQPPFIHHSTRKRHANIKPHYKYPSPPPLVPQYISFKRIHHGKAYNCFCCCPFGSLGPQRSRHRQNHRDNHHNRGGGEPRKVSTMPATGAGAPLPLLPEVHDTRTSLEYGQPQPQSATTIREAMLPTVARN